MSVQVSYKKQFLLGILILLTILVVVEGIARTYEFFDPKCGLVGKDVFENTDPLTVRQICYDFQILQYDQQTIILYEPNQHYPTTNINSYGMRGPEISKEKADDVYRVMFIGGSTAFGSGSTSDETTIPGYLQQKFNNENLDKKIEVINAGISGYYSLTEIFYIKNFLLEFEPDLLIVYDGINDSGYSQDNQPFELKYEENPQIDSNVVKETLKQITFYRTPFVVYRNLNIENPAIVFKNLVNENYDDDIMKLNETKMFENTELWKNRWQDICELGKEKEFLTIITVQPTLGSGNKPLSHDEEEMLKERTATPADYMQKFWDSLVDSLEDLDQVCEKTADLRDVFANTSEPVYFDPSHISDVGNEIVAQEFYELTLPVIIKDLVN